MIVLVNLNLIMIGLYISTKNQTILSITIEPKFGLENISAFLFGFLLIGYLVWRILNINNTKIYSKILKGYFVGLFILFYFLSVFVILYVNKSFTSPGKYESFKLNNSIWTDSICSFVIECNDRIHYVEVPLETCLKVDSIQLRVDIGVLGMKVYSENVFIKEKISSEEFICNYDCDSINYHTMAGNYYARKRYFNKAIQEYTNAIELDSLNPDNYYYRGIIYMFKQDYKRSLLDNYFALALKYRQLDSIKIKQLNSFVSIEVIDKIFNEIQNNNTTSIVETVNKLEIMNEFDSYIRKIKYCIKKTKN